MYEGFLTDEECNHLISLVSLCVDYCDSLSLYLKFEAVTLICVIKLGEIGAEEVTGGGQ